jgi:glycosyltransferase involved in cell wall biosynthesis
MRLLIFHGYLLRGTGSNVFTANLAAVLTRLGHQVHLLSQDRRPQELPFVGAVGDWDEGKLVVRRIREDGCTVYRPDIGGLLPVYVADRYEGILARPFPELSAEQLDAYVRPNVDAVAEVAARAKIEAALANHLVMGPVILARALGGTRIPYAVQIHGSALEYTVKPYPRFLPYAREGLDAARSVLVSSRHTAESLWAALDDPPLPTKTRLVPSGVDVDRFRPLAPEQALTRVMTLRERLAREHGGEWGRDVTIAANGLRELVQGAETDRYVAFAGKLIVSKGIDLLLAAWPLVVAAVPDARLVVVGFGEYLTAARRLIDLLADGDLAAVRSLAQEGRAAEGGPHEPLRLLLAFLGQVNDAYLVAARTLRSRVIFTGRLEHDELADVLAMCEAMVVPSTFPEAFGLVAVEAAACGVLPISAAHSGLAEVSQTLAAAVPDSARALLSFPVDQDVVGAIAAHVVAWLRAGEDLREATRTALVRTARERYSWEAVARAVIAAASGQPNSTPCASGSSSE